MCLLHYLLPRLMIVYSLFGLYLLQDELDDTAIVWNTHLIRPSKNMQVPSGRPNVMYAVPELYNTRDFLTPGQNDHVQLCRNQCVFRLTIPCDPDVYDICNILMAESQLITPADPYEAVNLYLREAVSALL
ncbi:hypothetical protein AMECASPLE_027450 [Ameca splendens]|uniref:Uncharacterized protein n=1 Tax=Ameca splendens TaxID=208324 RepID=A0ABV1AC31_9TELE